jgi:hypothetical protein
MDWHENTLRLLDHGHMSLGSRGITARNMALSSDSSTSLTIVTVSGEQVTAGVIMQQAPMDWHENIPRLRTVRLLEVTYMAVYLFVIEGMKQS